MAFLDTDEIYDAYDEAVKEADQWREDYPQYERLMNNGLMEDLDETLPEVNDGSLCASLFKLPKRVYPKNLTGRAKALDRDDAWLTELANLQWENEIIPNANSQAPFDKKWKAAIRNAAGYGSQPIITLFVNNGDYTGADILVPYVQDVKLEAGKVSDYDSDVIFWDVYYSKLQVKNMIEQAKAENGTGDGYNKWDIQALETILKGNQEDNRPGNNDHRDNLENGVKKTGIHFTIAFQRGIEAPFYMCHMDTKQTVREWSNPDPSGDIPVHYLYCYQDFINPYGIGIVKLAGGTQNVLDYMRQADVLATQLGLRPPIDVQGDADSADLDSITYTQDALWFSGNAKLTRQEMANGVYQELPNRIQMYQSSLNKILPMGDTSVSAGAGDPMQSKTPAGVKMAAASLSIDDEDFKDNLNICYAAVAKSMINTHFANMQGNDLMKLSDDERELLANAGLEFPVDDMGMPTNELDVVWDDARATFDFEVDPEQDKARDDDKRLEGLLKVAEFRASDPNFDAYMEMSGKRLNTGELYSEIVGLTTDNDKIIEDITSEEQEAMAAEEEAAAMGVDPATGQPLEGEVVDPEAEAAEINVQAVQEEWGVDTPTAAAMLEAERQGFSPEEIQEKVMREQGAVARG